MDMILIDESLPVRPGVPNDPSASPWGILAYDRGALSSAQQENLNSLKNSFLRKENRRYLMAHPQVTAVVSVILRATYLHRPMDPMKFIAELVGRADFDSMVHHYLRRNGPRTQGTRDLGKDLYSCINPELLVRKRTKIRPEQERIRLNIPEDGDSLGIESTYPVDFDSSVDSLKVFTAIGDEAVKLEKKIDKTYRKREKLAKKAVKKNLRSEISKKSVSQGESPDKEELLLLHS